MTPTLGNVRAVRLAVGAVTAAVAGDVRNVRLMLDGADDATQAEGGLGLAWVLAHLVARTNDMPVGQVLALVGHQLAAAEARLDVGGTVGSGG